MPGSTPGGDTDAPSLLTRWQNAWVKKELARWARDPPADGDKILFGPWRDWSFGQLFECKPGHVRWCLENLDPETCTQQQKRFLAYVERRTAHMEKQVGDAAPQGQAQEGATTAPGEASAPGGGSSLDGCFPMMLTDAPGECGTACPPPDEEPDAEMTMDVTALAGVPKAALKTAF